MKPRRLVETIRFRCARFMTVWRAMWLRFRGVTIRAPRTIGRSVALRWHDDPGRRGTLAIGEGVTLERGVVINTYGGDVRVGRDVHIGPYSVIYAHGGVEIGDDTLIAMHCCIAAANHSVPPVGIAIRSQPDVSAPVRIGRDVWLGARVCVLAGVEIGDGCVIGAGSVVTTSIPPGAIAQGTPARVVAFRAGAGPSREQ